MFTEIQTVLLFKSLSFRINQRFKTISLQIKGLSVFYSAKVVVTKALHFFLFLISPES